jgi:hypothetical protein
MNIMKLTFLAFLLVTTGSPARCLECSALDNFFAKADLFLRTHVSGGAVDYTAIRSNRTTLNELVTMMSTADLSSEGTLTTKAFWINAYNITMIKSVVDHMPINSPLDVAGMFDAKKHTVAGESLTLSDIENKKLRPVYHDARIHFVLVCGAKGCPSLLAGAYMPTTLDLQLTAQTRKALNDALWTQVDAAKRAVRLSEIFKWYEADFTTGGQTLIQYVNRYRSTPIPSDYKVEYYTYDWSLNIKK